MYCSGTCQTLPRSAQKGAASGASTVMAGAPVKPFRARTAADNPASAPQPDPSCSMVGLSISRIIWLRGPWYSAMPSASRNCGADMPCSRAAIAATPSAFQAPEVW